jgi:Pretoxin HINT domain
VKVGDKVLATDPYTGRTKAEPVLALIRHTGQHTMVLVTLADGSVLDATGGHKIWDATWHTFVDAGQLAVGDKIETDTGGLITVAARTDYSADLTAYNLQIDQIHTYYAGTTPVLVHNSCEDAVSYGLQQNQLDHVFVPKHNLAGLVSDAGSEQQAMTQIVQSVGNVPDGVYGPANQLVRQVGNYSVTIRGAMINGTFKIGTAFIP